MEGVVLEVGRPEKERPRPGLGGGHGAGRRRRREGESGGKGGLQVGAANSCRQKGTAGKTRPRIRQTWVQTPALPLPGHATQGKPLNRGDFA